MKMRLWNQKEQKLPHIRRSLSNLALNTTVLSRSRGLTQPSSRSLLTSFGISSADLYAAEDHCDEDVPSFENPSSPVCNQGGGKQSSFACILCSTKSAQGDTSVSPNESAYMRHSNTRAPQTRSCLTLTRCPIRGGTCPHRVRVSTSFPTRFRSSLPSHSYFAHHTPYVQSSIEVWITGRSSRTS